MENNNINYEYKLISTKLQKAAEVVACYENLGWDVMRRDIYPTTSKARLVLRRDYKIKNKSQLNRLQAQIEDETNAIMILEKGKTQRGAITAGIFGTAGALIMGGGMSLCLLNPAAATLEFIGGIAMGAVGLIICGLNALIYQNSVKRNTSKNQSLIKKKYEEIAELSERAGHLTTN